MWSSMWHLGNGIGDYMDIEQIKHVLEHHIDKLIKLRKCISNDGKPLGTNDKQLLRSTLSSTWLRDMQNEQRYMFDNGYADDLQSSFDNVLDTLISIT